MTTLRTTQANLPAGMIDLGLGQPGSDLLPLESLRLAAAHRLSQGDPDLLAYGLEQGDGYFRLALADFLSRGYGVPVKADELFITNGASQALDFICTLFAQPGDTIFVEEPTYFLALRIFADHRLTVVPVPTDEQGLIIEALEEKLRHHRPTLLYTIPTYHNPAGMCLAPERRARLLQLSESHDFLIVADEVYQLLFYTAPPPPPLLTGDQAGRVFSIGSFSKILAPGVRLGWIEARASLLNRLIRAGLVDSGGGLNPFTSGIVRSLIETGEQQTLLDALKTTYRQRLVVLSEALRQHVPALTFTQPAGGFFIWGYLPDGVDVQQLLSLAYQENVGFQPGIKFSSEGGLQNYMRLCFAYYDEAPLREGVRRLGDVVGKKGIL